MSTAVEMQLRQAQAEKWLEAARRRVWKEMVQPLTIIALGRTVHRQRARKLRRRGEVVQRVAPGKFKWLPAPFKFANPRAQSTPQPPAPPADHA